jgi:hypothetical protein
MLADDYNVVPTRRTSYPPRSLDKNALIQPESREAFARLLAQGWTDDCASCTRLERCGHFGIMNMSGGSRTKGHATRSPTALTDNIQPARGRRGRPMGAQGGKCQRPCPAWILLEFSPGTFPPPMASYPYHPYRKVRNGGQSKISM